jgi:hypothetical protein
MTLFRLVAAILMAMLLAGASMAAVITFDDLDAMTGDTRPPTRLPPAG